MKLQGQNCLQSGLSNLNFYIALRFFYQANVIWEMSESLKII